MSAQYSGVEFSSELDSLAEFHMKKAGEKAWTHLTKTTTDFDTIVGDLCKIHSAPNFWRMRRVLRTAFPNPEKRKTYAKSPESFGVMAGLAIGSYVGSRIHRLTLTYPGVTFSKEKYRFQKVPQKLSRLEEGLKEPDCSIHTVLKSEMSDPHLTLALKHMPPQLLNVLPKTEDSSVEYERGEQSYIVALGYMAAGAIDLLAEQLTKSLV